MNWRHKQYLNKYKKQRQMEKHAQELYDSTGKTPPNQTENLYQAKTVDGTPFTMIHQGENYFLTVGQTKLTENMTSEQHVLEYMKTHTWDLIIKLILTILNWQQSESNK